MLSQFSKQTLGLLHLQSLIKFIQNYPVKISGHQGRRLYVSDDHPHGHHHHCHQDHDDDYDD